MHFYIFNYDTDFSSLYDVDMINFVWIWLLHSRNPMPVGYDYVISRNFGKSHINRCQDNLVAKKIVSRDRWREEGAVNRSNSLDKPESNDHDMTWVTIFEWEKTKGFSSVFPLEAKWMNMQMT